MTFAEELDDILRNFAERVETGRTSNNQSSARTPTTPATTHVGRRHGMSCGRKSVRDCGKELREMGSHSSIIVGRSGR